MNPGSRFVERTFLVAGIYGIVVLLPQYFVESGIAFEAVEVGRVRFAPPRGHFNEPS